MRSFLSAFCRSWCWRIGWEFRRNQRCTVQLHSVIELKDKTIFVTGGAHRLGKAMTLAAAEAGAQVAFTYLQSSEEAKEVLAQIKAMGREGLSVSCDVRDSHSIAAAVEATVKRF